MIHHRAAAEFMESLQDSEDVAVSEFILLDLYVLLRHPAVLAKPLSSSAAVDVCEAFRQHIAATSTMRSGYSCVKEISPAAAPTTAVPRFRSSSKG
ncbi:MAG: hypothetical protein ACR2OZ_00430 [Verrucomicrobiales bacterium]